MSAGDDIAERVALASYGKSGRANAPCNQNPDFQAGYAAGSTLTGENGDAMMAIENEYARIGAPDVIPDSFKEWKRGMWAAVLQKAAMNLSKGMHED